MKRWITTVVQPNTVNAVFKAKEDVLQIALQNGYQPVSIFRYNSKNESNEAMDARIDGITAAVSHGDIVVFQYPTYVGNRFDLRFMSHLVSRGAKVVVFLHDAESLRGPIYFDEIGAFSQCAAIVTHNQNMSNELKKRGLKAPTIENTAFDYLTTISDTPARDTFQRAVTFAGSLDKSRFLADWQPNTPISVFGRHDAIKLDPKVNDMGEMFPDKLAYFLPYCFGLAWDSNIPGGGQYKNYTRYNNPHKVSMYLANGRPVILWKEAGMAPFIESNHLGITLNSLDELDDAIAGLSDGDIDQMLSNIQHVRRALQEGFFTTHVLHRAEDMLLHPDIILD
mgnify:CR=1 FL=1